MFIIYLCRFVIILPIALVSCLLSLIAICYCYLPLLSVIAISDYHILLLYFVTMAYTDGSYYYHIILSILLPPYCSDL